MNGSRYRCCECDQPCDVIVVDEGIGPYEYQGMKGVDRRPAAVSDCCEAGVIDNNGNNVTVDDLEPPEC